ncbi:YutD family protein [Spirillospora sp. NPDC046719]
MAKVIDESKLNYNKYPGEHVMAVGEVVQVGQRTFHIVHNYREAFDAEKLEQRFSDVLDKYDYIVGDWGFEQLRLKGFFSTSRRKMLADNKIDHLEDYVNEYWPRNPPAARTTPPGPARRWWATRRCSSCGPSRRIRRARATTPVPPRDCASQDHFSRDRGGKRHDAQKAARAPTDGRAKKTRAG